MISIVVGKPGSGKSYEVVRALYDRYETAANLGGSLPVTYTNLRLNLKAWGKFSEFINLLSDDDLFGEWWEQFPEGALVVLDEAQYYLSDKRLEHIEITKLEEHFSTHRHKNLEYILITQNLTSLSQGVRRYAQTVTQINNHKNIVLPFPLNVPARDVQVLLRGFGIVRQSYWATTGDLINSHKVEKDLSSVYHVTSKEIYNLYSTNKTGARDDMPLPFKLDKWSPFRALAWFYWKHFWNFSIKLGVIGLASTMIFHYYFASRKNYKDILRKREEAQTVQKKSSISAETPVSKLQAITSGGVKDGKKTFNDFPLVDDNGNDDRLPISARRAEF